MQTGEEIVLRSSGEAFAESFLARYGSRVRKFVVDVSERNRLVVSAPNRRGSELEVAVGDRVRLSWAQADGWVIAEP